jgi:signal transduction histidine kinase
MSLLLPDFLRAFVDATMNVLLMLSLLQPKYGKKVTAFTMVGISLVDIMIAVFCYLSNNLTQVAKWEFVLFTILCFVVRSLFKDSFMQWLFSYITVRNIDICTTVLSFSISRVMPYPSYANPLVRVVLYLGIFYLIRRYIRPMYGKIIEHWNVFFYVAAALVIAFSYYIVSSKDIVQTLTNQAIPLHLLVLVTVAAYVSIFFTLQTITQEYDLREENLKMQNNQELLHLSAHAMEGRVKMLDDAQQKSRIELHDRRHFNNTLLELLEQQKIEDAIDFLKKQSASEPAKVRNCCENTIVNAAVCYYAGLAKNHDISIDINLDIPGILPFDSLELAMVLSNLMENAIHACESLDREKERYIRLNCHHVGRLILEISNPCDDSILLDEYDHPIAKQKGHGAGTKSILAFAKEHDAEVFYQIRDGVFRVRLLI